MKQCVICRESVETRGANYLTRLHRELEPQCVIIYMDESLLQFYPRRAGPYMEVVGFFIKRVRYGIYGEIQTSLTSFGKHIIVGRIVLTRTELLSMPLIFGLCVAMIWGMCSLIYREHMLGHRIVDGVVMLMFFIALWVVCLKCTLWRAYRAWQEIRKLLLAVISDERIN